VRLYPERGAGEAFFRQYDRFGSGWVPRMVYEKTDSKGRWSLDTLTWLNPALERFLEEKRNEAKKQFFIDALPEPRDLTRPSGLQRLDLQKLPQLAPSGPNRRMAPRKGKGPNGRGRA
jgi:hypothetical protein